MSLSYGVVQQRAVVVVSQSDAVTDSEFGAVPPNKLKVAVVSSVVCHTRAGVLVDYKFSWIDHVVVKQKCSRQKAALADEVVSV
jgi:hypothetical protein